jgi:hypothetical protein
VRAWVRVGIFRLGGFLDVSGEWLFDALEGGYRVEVGGSVWREPTNSNGVACLQDWIKYSLGMVPHLLAH